MEGLGSFFFFFFFIFILLYGLSAMGDAYEGGGCLGVIGICLLIMILAAFGL